MSRNRDCRAVKLPIPTGIVPEKEFVDNHRIWSEVMVVIPAGMVPPMELWLKSKYLRTAVTSLGQTPSGSKKARVRAGTYVSAVRFVMLSGSDAAIRPKLVRLNHLPVFRASAPSRLPSALVTQQSWWFIVHKA